jgi:hypothetical protein
MRCVSWNVKQVGVDCDVFAGVVEKYYYVGGSGGETIRGGGDDMNE